MPHGMHPGDPCRILRCWTMEPASGVHQAHTYKVKWPYFLSITICGDAPAGSIERRPANTKIDPLLPDVVETISKRWVGAAVGRKEDEALLTGHARFIDDVYPIPGICFAAVLRAPPAHARIQGGGGRPARGRPAARALLPAKGGL